MDVKRQARRRRQRVGRVVERDSGSRNIDSSDGSTSDSLFCRHWIPRVREKEERWSVALDTRRTSRTFSMECEIRGAKEMLSCHWLECLTSLGVRPTIELSGLWERHVSMAVQGAR